MRRSWPSPPRALASELAKHRLASAELVVEDPARHVEQVTHERVAQGVAHAGADLRGDHDVLRSQDRKLLRDDRLLETERVLQVLDASFTGDEDLEDPDPDRMGQRLEELGLESLEVAGRGHPGMIYSNITLCKTRARGGRASRLQRQIG